MIGTDFTVLAPATGEHTTHDRHGLYGVGVCYRRAYNVRQARTLRCWCLLQARQFMTVTDLTVLVPATGETTYDSHGPYGVGACYRQAYNARQARTSPRAKLIQV